jgi:AraC-like DNA-binding protein
MVPNLAGACSTQMIPVGRRLSFWNDIAAAHFGRLNIDSPADNFDSKLAVRRIGTLELVMINTAVAASVTRGNEAPAETERHTFKLLLQDYGSCRSRQDGQDIVLRDGDFSLCDASRAHSLEFQSAHRMMVLRLPVDTLVGRVADPNRFVGRHKGRTPRSIMLTSFIRNLWATSGQHEAEDDEWHRTMSNLLLDLLGLVYAEERDGSLAAAIPAATASMTAGLRLRQRVCDHIAQNLHEPGLRTSTIAAELGISPRLVQLAFAGGDETVTAYIQRQRLEQAARRLRSGPLDTPISQIAYEAGFQDLSYFSRSFRSQYGLAPREYRAGE